MEKLDILESLWENIKEFKNRFERCGIIPQTLENYLISVARTGNIIFPWDHVKFLFRCKLVLALREFGDEKGIEDEVLFLNRFNNFRDVPFTIQRLTELLLEPKQHYTSKKKYLRALEKCIWITLSVEEVGILSHHEVKKEVNDAEFENGGGNEGQLDNNSWLADNDASYLEQINLESTDLKVNLDQPMKKEIGNVMNCEMADIHRVPIMENKKKIDSSLRSNIFCGKPWFSSIQQSLSNLNAPTYLSPPTQKCPFCPLTFLTQFLLKWHINDKHTQEKTPKQNVNDTGRSCNNLFSCSESSRNLQWKHAGGNIHHSQVCDKTFGTEQGLKRPMKSHQNYKKPLKTSSDESNQEALKKKSEKRKFNCSFCQKSFKEPSALKVHERVHTGERPFSCEVCKKAFTRQSILDVHLRTHTGEKPFRCLICKRAFTRQQHLDVHLRTHTGEKPFVCSVCGNAFADKRNCNKHMRIHTGEKPFSCAVCNNSFSEKQTLNRHLTTHTGEKPFSCSVCEKAFARKCNLYVHFRTHTGEKPFVCSVCGKRFSHSSNLKIHSKNSH